MTSNGRWPQRTLSSLCKTISSGGTPSRGRPEFFVDDGHLWVKSKELLDCAIATTEERISDAALRGSSAKMYPSNTVLVAMYGANVGQLGWLQRNATVNQAICALVSDPTEADARYLFYVLMHARPALVSQAFGAAQQNLNQGLIREFNVPCPPLPTQRRIAAILAAYDDLIENNMRRIAILEEMARSLYREWFVNFRFPGHENVEMVDSPIGTIPEGWRPSTLADIAADSRRSIQPQSVEGDTAYVGLEHLPRRSIALQDWGAATSVQSTKLLFDKGDILFGKIRPYLHKVSVAPVSGVCSSDAIVITAKEPWFAGLTVTCVSSDDFVAHATQTSQGTKMPRANWDVLLKYPVSLPPAPLLERFNNLVTDMVAMVMNLVMSNRTLRHTRGLLLPRLISGELDVSDLDIDTGELSA